MLFCTRLIQTCPIVRSGVWPMGCLVGSLRPNPWTVFVVLHTFEANLPNLVVVRSGGWPMGCSSEDVWPNP